VFWEADRKLKIMVGTEDKTKYRKQSKRCGRQTGNKERWAAD